MEIFSFMAIGAALGWIVATTVTSRVVSSGNVRIIEQSEVNKIREKIKKAEMFLNEGSYFEGLTLFRELRKELENYKDKVTGTERKGIDSSIKLCIEQISEGLIKQKVYKEAINLLEEELAIFPQDVELMKKIVRVNLAMDNKNEAITYLEKIIALDNMFLDGYRRLGKLYLETNRREKAVKIFYNAIDQFPDEPRVRIEMLERIFLSTPSEDSAKLKTLKDFTDELIRDKNLIKAEELLKDTAKLVSDSRLTVELGKIQYKLGKFDNVITQLENMEKHNLEGKYYLGATHFIQGNIDKALIFFTEIIDFNNMISTLPNEEKIKHLKAVELEGETDSIVTGLYNSILYNSMARAGEIYRRRGLIEDCEKLFLQLLEHGSRYIDDTIIEFFSALSSDFGKKNDEREHFWKNQITQSGQAIVKKKQSKTSYEDFWLLFSPSEPGADDIIGEGGMAIVYRGTELKTGRKVAIKKMHRNFCLSPEARSFFHKEVSVMERLSRPVPHPNIVEFIAHGICDDRFVFAMELVEGKSLRDKLIEGEITTFEDMYSIIIQICAGLEKTHEEHIVHRDLKPENILVTTEGNVKLTDFGISRITSLTTSTRHNYQRTRSFVGTSYYSAPEQYPDPYDGKLPPIDNRADIYSLGCIIYEMVTTQPPFLHDDPGIVGLMHQRRSIEGKSVTEIITPGLKNPLLLEHLGLNQEEIKELDRIVMKCLKKNPIARYQSVNELKEDFIKLIKLSKISN